MMTVFGMVVERHGSEFPVVNGRQPGPVSPSPATHPRRVAHHSISVFSMTSLAS
jgi:hypothetical protein